MAKRVDRFDGTYRHFTDRALGAIRKDSCSVAECPLTNLCS
jgi:hypothetical protein